MTANCDLLFTFRDDGTNICIVSVRVATVNFLDALNAAHGLTEAKRPKGWVTEGRTCSLSDFSSHVYNDLRMRTTFREPRRDLDG